MLIQGLALRGEVWVSVGEMRAQLVRNTVLGVMVPKPYLNPRSM